MRSLLKSILLSLLPLTASAQYAQESVLASGDWYQICVGESGIYRINPNLLGQLGIDAANISPGEIHLFGARGGMLPEAVSASRPDDLQAIPLGRADNGDANFSANEFLYFYAEGANQIIANAQKKSLSHQKNIYADENCYFLVITNKFSQKNIDEININQNPDEVLDRYSDIIWKEDDINNILKSGREWFGDKYSFNTEGNYIFNIPNIVENSVLAVKARVMSTSFGQASTFRFTLNNQAIGDIVVDPVFDGTYNIKGRIASRELTIAGFDPPANGQLNIGLEYERPASNAIGYLDYLSIQCERHLRWEGVSMVFRNFDSPAHDVVAYSLANATSQLKAWDITNPFAVREMTTTIDGARLRFRSEGQTLKTFVVFDPAAAAQPRVVGSVPNQNLHGLLTPPDLIIITPALFAEQANRLASFRRNFDGLKVTVVDIEQIYREFSSGKQDLVAIRDFLRMIYRRHTDQDQLRYVLLFGDASYDYKNRAPINTNFIPVYESDESLHPIYSYSSDDYIGMLDDGEGIWGINDADDMEVGIGRIPFATPEEAKTVVDKLIHYSQSASSLGNWRQQLVFVADDGDGNLHQTQADQLAEMVDTTYGSFKNAKLYVDAFPQVNLDANTKKAPQLRQRLNDFVQNGSLIINFTGHGAESGWTSEGILDVASVSGWDNLDNMPLLVTATCEFGRYDDPLRRSAAELSLLHDRGGAIALLTTTRPVFANSNFVVNSAFYKAVFEPLPSGEMPRLGDVFRRTKNNSILRDNNRNFTLLGDPSMRLAYPKAQIRVNRIATDEAGETDTLRALNLVTLEGQIEENGQLDATFEGTLYATLFDKPVISRTLGDENPVMEFEERKQVLFRGRASVTDGRFSFQFVIPKDISYPFGEGRLNLYAMPNQGLKDAGGYADQIVIGGSATQFVPDNAPPQISVFLDGLSFENGDVVNASPRLIIRLSDESGINTTGIGVDHDIKATFLSVDREALILNEFYTTDQDDFTSGTAEYQFSSETPFPPGVHRMRITAWDIHNNPAQAEVTFRVLGQQEAYVDQVVLYPNPASESLTFDFCHNQAGERMAAELTIFNALGQQVRQFAYQFNNAERCISLPVVFSQGNQNPLLPGIYFYHMKLSGIHLEDSHRVTGQFVIE